MRSKARFIIALGLAGVLGAALVWFSIGGSLETYAAPGDLQANGETYRLHAVVSDGAPADVAKQALSAEGTKFRVQDQDDPSKTVWVNYRGIVPDTFQDGREIVVTGHLEEGGTFVGKRDTLIAKCPSKFEAQKSPQPAAEQ